MVARTQALEELQQRAAALGAHAIVGVDMDYEVLGQGNMLMVHRLRHPRYRGSGVADSLGTFDGQKAIGRLVAGHRGSGAIGRAALVGRQRALAADDRLGEPRLRQPAEKLLDGRRPPARRSEGRRPLDDVRTISIRCAVGITRATLAICSVTEPQPAARRRAPERDNTRAAPGPARQTAAANCSSRRNPPSLLQCRCDQIFGETAAERMLHRESPLRSSALRTPARATSTKAAFQSMPTTKPSAPHLLAQLVGAFAAPASHVHDARANQRPLRQLHMAARLEPTFAGKPVVVIAPASRYPLASPPSRFSTL